VIRGIGEHVDYQQAKVEWNMAKCYLQQKLVKQAKVEWNMAKCYLQQKLVKQALEHSNNAVNLIGTASDCAEYSDSMHVAMLITLSTCYMLCERYQDAHDVLCTALEIGTEQTAVHQALAKVYTVENKRSKALAELQHALDSQHDCSRPIDTVTANICYEIGSIYAASNDAQQAISYLSRAYAIYNSVCPNEPETDTCRLQLSAVMSSVGQFEKAEPLLIAAEQSHEARHGKYHTRTLQVLRDRALLLINNRQWSTALPLLQRLVVRQHRAYGFGSLQMADTLWLIGKVHLIVEEYSFALFVLSQAHGFLVRQAEGTAKKVEEIAAMILKVQKLVSERAAVSSDTSSQSSYGDGFGEDV
jgi:tetratricopeptide (TPR) repeat protein